MVFEPDGGYIEKISDGSRTKMEKNGTIYTIKVWAKARNAEDEINTVSSEHKTGFAWQDRLL